MSLKVRVRECECDCALNFVYILRSRNLNWEHFLLEGDCARVYLVLLNDHHSFLFAYSSYHSRSVHPKLVSQ